jgi:hypothetical protein
LDYRRGLFLEFRAQHLPEGADCCSAELIFGDIRVNASVDGSGVVVEPNDFGAVFCLQVSRNPALVRFAIVEIIVNFLGE